MKKRFAAVLACMLIAVVFAVPSLAEAPVGMEKANVAWDLEVKTPVTTVTRFTGMDKDFPVEYSITGWKDTVNKQGMRQISFTLNFTNKFVPTKEETETISRANVNGEIGGTWGWTLVDYDTGLDIEDVNDVQLTQKDDKKVNQKKYTGKNGGWIRFSTKATCRITITCPKDYDGLCIGVIGLTVPIPSETDTAFWEGKVPFSETTYCPSEGEPISHFMRVRALPEE